MSLLVEQSNGLDRLLQDSPVVCLMGPSVLDRQAYRVLLERELRYRVAVESDFAPASVWSALRADPHLVLACVDTPRGEVRDAIQMVAQLRPAAKVLVVSAAVDPDVLRSWSCCEFAGFVVKTGGVEELVRGIDAILAGNRYYSDGVQAVLNQERRSVENKSQLSRRESELLPLLARGMTLREAASAMTISYKTADSYRTSLLRKLGVRDRVELARYAIRERIIEP